MKITDVRVRDVRFPTSRTLTGSDAVHKDPDYSVAYVELSTDEGLVGHGFSFTLGMGNEVVCKGIESLAYILEGQDVDEILEHMMDEEKGLYHALTQHGQLRWLGPEKGVIALASTALLNAVWDLWARREGKPLWELVADMEPEQLVSLISFKHITDFVTPEEALDLLKSVRDGWEERKALMKNRGFRAYTTSAGWLGYPIDKVRSLCQQMMKEGHKLFKIKVGGDIDSDVERAMVVREEIGEDCMLMMDANQRWDVDEAVQNMARLAVARPIWIEEPTNCDDVLGHGVIATCIKELGIGVASGEVAHSKVMFKQFFQNEALKYCQIDSCRVSGGISEILAILLMAAKAGVKVCPHAGGVGLCEYVRHLCMIDFVVFNPKDEADRVCEYTDQLHDHFDDPVTLARGAENDGVYYRAALAPGYSRMLPESLDANEFPHGVEWSSSQPKGSKKQWVVLAGIAALGAAVLASIARRKL